MIYEIKKGSKTYDFVKDLLEKENKEKEKFYKRVEETVGFKFDSFLGYTPNGNLRREYCMTSILVPVEIYETLDPKLWRNKGNGQKGLVSIIPNRRTKKGKEIASAFNSYRSVIDISRLYDGLGITAGDVWQVAMPQLLGNGEWLGVSFADTIRADKENKDLVEITVGKYQDIMNE